MFHLNLGQCFQLSSIQEPLYCINLLNAHHIVNGYIFTVCWLKKPTYVHALVDPTAVCLLQVF